MAAVDFSAAIQAQFDGATVRQAKLVVFDFVSGPVRLWEGADSLVIAGDTYRGIGNLGRMNAISAGPGQAVEEIVFQLAGSPEMLVYFTADSAESVGREVRIYIQFFADDWSPLDTPVQIFWGRMGSLIVDRPRHNVGDPAGRIITVRATNPFTNRRRAPNAFFSDSDQKARGDGTDNIFIRASQMASAKVPWPHF